jgi:putative adhesin
MKFAICLLMASGLGVLCSARPHSDQWPIREQTTIQKTLELSAPPMRVVVDNVEGYVHVTGSGGSVVRIVAHETIRAETANDLQEAKSEVKLNIDSKPGSVSVYYDAPWRCNNGCCNGCNDRHRRFYNVTYDIDIQVPHQARTVVSTVNDGDIRLDGTGDFDISNVNGAIAMNGISGSGDAHTVNGPITIRFAKNPSGPCSFKSINGEMDAYFPGELSADLAFKTFNGQIYSDFDVQPRAVQASQTEGQNRKFKFVYRSNGVRGGRAGHGGPELTFDAFNGSIRLHREQ